jgi:hypothetical protein
VRHVAIAIVLARFNGKGKGVPVSVPFSSTPF